MFDIRVIQAFPRLHLNNEKQTIRIPSSKYRFTVEPVTNDHSHQRPIHHPSHTTTFRVTDSGFCSYTNPSRATIPLIRPHQCDSEGGRIRGVLLYNINKTNKQDRQNYIIGFEDPKDELMLEACIFICLALFVSDLQDSPMALHFKYL